MKKLFVMGAAMLLIGGGLIGCSNTEKGAEQDTAQVGQKASETVNQAADATKMAAQNAAAATKDAAHDAAVAAKDAAANVAGAAKEAGKDTAENLDVRPKVKLAITADPQLNNVDNLIKVEPKDGVVYLRGHVKSTDMKAHAMQITKKALNEMHSTDKIQNELEVK